ncbi:MAG: peptidylprolyl isomerase [Myxococcota bacterium]|nr:peptidylprolyl isomerase [Myxococcota bacterium]MDW8363263.1 peptidylprolyl isomerase [Myxococcales bacterium]
MLEKLAQKVSRYVAGAIIVLLCVVFALQFGGPQAEGCSSRQLTATSYAVRVYGETITEGEFRAVMTLAGYDAMPVAQQRALGVRQLVLDGLVDRLLLARHARRIGFQVGEEEALETLARDGTILATLSYTIPGSPGLVVRRISFRDAQDRFDLEAARGFIQYSLRRSVAEFTRWQVEERLAERVRDLVAAAVTVSPAEVWDAFVAERETATLEYARFSPEYYRDTLRVADAELQAWMDTHRERLDREVEGQRHRYRGLERQVRARHILVSVSEDASEQVRAAARARIESLLRRARAGEDFAELARRHSDDTVSARRGGDLGWNPRGRMQPSFDEAMFALEPGQLSDVVQTRYGFHIIRCEGVREGDVPDAEVRREVAEDLFRRERGQQIARERAQRAIEEMRAGTSLDELRRRLAEESGRTSESTATSQDESDDPLAPHADRTVAFGRTDEPVPGDDGTVVRVAFGLTEENPVAPEPVEVGGAWYALRLAARTHARREQFTPDERLRLAEQLRRRRTQEAMRLLVAELRREAEADGAIRRNDELLAYESATSEGPDERSDESGR